jgi:membrane protease subunit (stomatin/prohibitin family)
VRIIVSGQFAYKISDPLLFITQFIGTKGMQHTDQIANWFQDQIMMVINTTLGKLKKDKSMGILDMPAYLSEIEQFCLSKLTHETEQYGITITKFSGLVIKLPETVQEAIDKRSAMSALGVNFMQFQTGQAIGGIGEGASKGGDVSGFAGLGAGMGAGYAMSQAMGQSMTGQNPQAPAGATVCQKCGFTANGSLKFCPECGNSMKLSNSEEMYCPSCKCVIRPGVKFCPECGRKIVTNCPKCNSNLVPGVKFCPNCGERIATRYITKMDKKEAYRFVPSAFNKKKVNS